MRYMQAYLSNQRRHPCNADRRGSKTELTRRLSHTRRVMVSCPWFSRSGAEGWGTWLSRRILPERSEGRMQKLTCRGHCFQDDVPREASMRPGQVERLVRPVLPVAYCFQMVFSPL